MQTINAYIHAATPTLILLCKVKQLPLHKNTALLHQQFIHEIQRFEAALSAQEVDPHHVLKARYCLCAIVDETILKTHWGMQSPWIQQSLLGLFHHETQGGKRFFEVLEYTLQEPRKHLQLIEYLFLLLSLGFEGQLYNQSSLIQDEVRLRLFIKIKQLRGKMSRSLSSHWKDNIPNDQNQKIAIFLKRLSVSAIGLLISLTLIANIFLYDKAFPVIQALQHIGRESPVTTFSQLLDRPIVHHSLEFGS